MYSKPFEVGKLVCVLSSKAAPISPLRYMYGLFSYKTKGLKSAFIGDKNPHFFCGEKLVLKNRSLLEYRRYIFLKKKSIIFFCPNKYNK